MKKVNKNTKYIINQSNIEEESKNSATFKVAGLINKLSNELF